MKSLRSLLLAAVAGSLLVLSGCANFPANTPSAIPPAAPAPAKAPAAKATP